MVAISAVQYSNGHRYDLDTLGDVCRRSGALLVVDGTQSVGAMTIDVNRSHIDVLAVSAHKWMLGPSGIGFVHVSDRALDRIRPDIVGWLSVAEPFAFDYRLDLPRTADRYEPGTENIFGIIGLGAAVSLFLDLGTHEVEQRVLALTDYLCDELERTGHQIISPRSPTERSGIVIFHKVGHRVGGPARPADRRRHQVRASRRWHPILTPLLQHPRRNQHRNRGAREPMNRELGRRSADWCSAA